MVEDLRMLNEALGDRDLAHKEEQHAQGELNKETKASSAARADLLKRETHLKELKKQLTH